MLWIAVQSDMADVGEVVRVSAMGVGVVVLFVGDRGNEPSDGAVVGAGSWSSWSSARLSWSSVGVVGVVVGEIEIRLVVLGRAW